MRGITRLSRWIPEAVGHREDGLDLPDGHCLEHARLQPRQHHRVALRREPGARVPPAHGGRRDPRPGGGASCARSPSRWAAPRGPSGAVSPEASLERELGLGSLERVELLARLERAFGRPLGRPPFSSTPRPTWPAPSCAAARGGTGPVAPARLTPSTARRRRATRRRRRPSTRRLVPPLALTEPDARRGVHARGRRLARHRSPTAGSATRRPPWRAACASAASPAATPSP